jgi:hypothetical protein
VVASGSYGDEPLRKFIAEDPWGENPLPFLAGQTWTYVQCKDCEQAYHRDILAPKWNDRRFEKWMTQDAIRTFEEAITTPRTGKPRHGGSIARGKNRGEARA